MIPAAAPTLVVPLRSRRQQRALFVQQLQHGAVGLVLLFQGLDALTRGAEGLELAIAPILFRSLPAGPRQWRRRSRTATDLP